MDRKPRSATVARVYPKRLVVFTNLISVLNEESRIDKWLGGAVNGPRLLWIILTMLNVDRFAANRINATSDLELDLARILPFPLLVLIASHP